jgi:hypothetical protein
MMNNLKAVDKKTKEKAFPPQRKKSAKDTQRKVRARCVPA